MTEVNCRVGQAETEDQRLDHGDVSWRFGRCVRETERWPTNAWAVDADPGGDAWWAGAGVLVRQDVVVWQGSSGRQTVSCKGRLTHPTTVLTTGSLLFKMNCNEELAMSTETPRLLILGAHPDDAEYHAGGLATIYRQHGYCVKMVSVTHATLHLRGGCVMLGDNTVLHLWSCHRTANDPRNHSREASSFVA